MSKYSFSRIQTYKQCPLKYRFKYIDRIKDQDFTLTADLLLGSAVHYALEKLYEEISNFKSVEEEKLLEFFYSYWNSEVESLKASGEELLVREGSIEGDFQLRGEEYLKAYYENNTPFDKIKVVDTEANVSFALDEDVSFAGFIDRLDKDGDTFVINDYKTNKRLPTENKDSMKEQLTLYAIGVKEKYGKYLKKIKARLYFLHFDIEDTWEITDELLFEVTEKYRWLVKEIESKKAKFVAGEKDIFEVNETPLCRFCEYTSICPLFTHITNNGDEVDGISPETIRLLIDDYNESAIREKEAKKEKDGIKKVLIAFAKKNNFKKLYGKTCSISVSSRVNYSAIDKEELKELLGKLWFMDKVMDLNLPKLNKLIKDNEIDIENLGNTVKKSDITMLRLGKKVDLWENIGE